MAIEHVYFINNTSIIAVGSCVLDNRSHYQHCPGLLDVDFTPQNCQLCFMRSCKSCFVDNGSCLLASLPSAPCWQDEMLAHRLGLVPLKIDPRCLSFKSGPESSASQPLNWCNKRHRHSALLMCCDSCSSESPRPILNAGQIPAISQPQAAPDQCPLGMYCTIRSKGHTVC